MTLPESTEHIAAGPLPGYPTLPLPVFDAAIVPGGPIMQRDGVYVPADYSQLRQGRYATIERVCGLLALYKARHLDLSPEILFTGGISEPTNGRIDDGPVPPESVVNSCFFIRGLVVVARNYPDFAEWLRPQTITIHEDIDTNSSVGNARIAQALAQLRQWPSAVASTNSVHCGRFSSHLLDPAFQPECGTKFRVEPGEQWKFGVFGHVEGEMRQLLYPHLYDTPPDLANWIEVLNAQTTEENRGLIDMRNGTYTPKVGPPSQPDVTKVKTWKLPAADLL